MNNKGKIHIYIGSLLLLLLFSSILSILVGAVKLPLDLVLKILGNHLPFVNIEQDWAPFQEAIVWKLRLPRILLAAIIGGMLSLSGAAFQGVLRNPLADPYILGVSSGAALGAAIHLLFVNQVGAGSYTLPLFAFIGSILSLSFVMVLGKVNHFQKNETIILAGVIVQAFTGAVLTFLIAISNEKMQSIIFWMMGSLANKEWIDFFVLLPYFTIGSIYLLAQYQVLNILALGESSASYLGVDVRKKKLVILIIASLLASAAVSVVGVIGFVGLVIPHLIRLITGANHRILLPVTLLAGSIFLVATDTIARTIIPSRELPIGVVTAFIGAPFFAYLLRKGMRSER